MTPLFLYSKIDFFAFAWYYFPILQMGKGGNAKMTPGITEVKPAPVIRYKEEMQKVMLHLMEQFGMGAPFQRCDLFDSIIAPPNNVLIRVLEPIGYQAVLYGMCVDRVLEPGVYLTGELEPYPTEGNHPMMLVSQETGETIWIDVGIINRTLIDWRKIEAVDQPLDPVMEDDLGVLRDYLENTFGGYQDWCGLLAPPEGSVVKVARPLREPDAMNRKWLALPVDTYLIGKIDKVMGINSCSLHVVAEKSHIDTVMIGYIIDTKIIDWRGAVPA